MIFTLALRSLLAHPVRSAVLAAGFGLGVAVMAILLGVGRVVLEQAQSPELYGGGDVRVTGSAGDIIAARVLLGGVLKTPALAPRVRAASPWERTTLYWADANQNPDDASHPRLPVRARGGIPSLERALYDPETANQSEWIDTPADKKWASPDAGDVLRAIDRFHPIPDVPARAASWAEWLYFNGRAERAKFYLTFMVGPQSPGGRLSGVRLQLDRGRGVESYSASETIDAAAIARAPDLSIANNSVQLDGMRYRLQLDLIDARGRRATGTLNVGATLGRLLPPLEIHGASGWRSGYVVPVMSGPLGGTLAVDGETISFDGGVGYHDHNWGFWEGVSWQWGQVHHGDTAFVYGRVFPPRDAADPARMPGFLGALGPDGPIGYSTNVTIDETKDANGQPTSIVIRGRGAGLDLTMSFAVESAVVNRMKSGALGNQLDFMQMRGAYNVRGTIGERPVAFEADGSAETFRRRTWGQEEK